MMVKKRLQKKSIVYGSDYLKRKRKEKKNATKIEEISAQEKRSRRKLGTYVTTIHLEKGRTRLSVYQLQSRDFPENKDNDIYIRRVRINIYNNLRYL